MKKNKMLRAASLLLVLVLLTTSVIGGTFAKYTTTGRVSDTARVAKFGVVLTTGGSLFGENYETGENSVPSTKTDAASLSVMNGDTSAAVKNLVAPGTKSENGLSFSINGTPEVRTKVEMTVTAQDIYLAAGTYAVMRPVTVNATTFADKIAEGIYTETDGSYTKVATNATFSDVTYYELSNKVTVAEGGYYPVQYHNTNSAANNTKVTEIAKAIAGKVNTDADADVTTAKASYTVSKNYDPNTDLATKLSLGANTITWAWDFEVGTTNEEKAATDAKDTILGDLMARSTVVAVDGDTVTVLAVDGDGIVKKDTTEVGSLVTSFAIELTVTQID